MLSEICAHIRNYFTYESDKHPGTYKVQGGALVPSVELPTEYYAIFGSRKNNGVHKATDTLKDEGEFSGNVWVMSVPDDFLSLAEEIGAWQAKYGCVDSEANSPFNSESFGGYSYTKSTNASSAGGTDKTTWMGAYASRLNRWRKVSLH